MPRAGEGRAGGGKDGKMTNIFKIAVRNLTRYKRRTLLTLALITLGVVFVLVFVSVTGSFKSLMIGQITGSYLGDIQIHKRGYVASIENLPLNLNLAPDQVRKVREVLGQTKEVQASSERVKFGALFSNFQETTNIRINGVVPEQEFAACPLLLTRIVQGRKDAGVLEKGTILVPDLLARGFGSKIGDTVVVVATNKDGSVNGKTFRVAGILESATGPGGRDGYIHIEDAREILRMEQEEVSEFAVSVRDLGQADRLEDRLRAGLSSGNQQGKSPFEVHSWVKLSPFANIARMIDVMTFYIRLMLISLVLISILNVMIMAVYERVREIGTIAALGTRPAKILSLFLVEGFSLGVAGALSGTILALAVILVLNVSKISFSFGFQQAVTLAPTISTGEVAGASLLVILISVLASLQPAYKASRMAPIDALRHI